MEKKINDNINEVRTDKVYCKNCKYYRMDFCTKRIVTTKNKYTGRKKTRGLRTNENKTGDCKYYKPKLRVKILNFIFKLFNIN